MASPEVAPTLLHSTPGRIRIHLSASEEGQREIESRLRRMAGVNSVAGSPMTGNVVIRFSTGETNQQAILQAASSAGAELPIETQGPQSQDSVAEQAAPPARAPLGPHVLRGRPRDGKQRARVSVRGLDRDPDLSRQVVQRLQKHPGVTAHANPLTGRVLIMWDDDQSDIRDLISAIADVELPDVPGDDTPAHPLDPSPVIQSAGRTAGAAIALTVLGSQLASGRSLFAQSGPAANVAGIVGIVQGFPATRNGARRVLGRDACDLLFQGAAIVSLAISGSFLGLLVSGVEGLRLLTEVLARRAAWRRYEKQLAGVASAEPGRTIRLEAGERTPRKATVVEGNGTAAGRDALPVAISPGSSLEAGSRLAGGPFVVHLESAEAWTPQPRPAPASPRPYDRYQQTLGLVSLAYSVLLCVITRSPGRLLEGLLLVNPRTASIGMEAGGLSAAARVLRGGVIVVGTRRERGLRLPDSIILDGPRVVSDGLELSGIAPLQEDVDGAAILALAAGVTLAAGAPWGSVFSPAGAVAAADGNFDGRAATAQVQSETYSVAMLNPDDAVDAAAPYRKRGDQLLALRREGDDAETLGLVALRPKIATGAAELVSVCRKYNVALTMLPAGNPDTVAAVARRTGIEALGRDAAVAQIRERQQLGERVAFVSDSAHAAEAFAACDLAVGLSSGKTSQFPARADYLAPDVASIAAIVEACGRCEMTTRDSIGLSIISNITGAVWGFAGAPGVARASLAVYTTALAALADGWLRQRGGEGARSTVSRLVDPHPERWGRQTPEQAMRALHTTAEGLTQQQALQRRRPAPLAVRRSGFASSLVEQLNSPLIGLLAAGAGLSLLLGSPLDFALIGATILVNVLVGAWQERQAGNAAQALARLGVANARVLRGGVEVSVPSAEVVPGDILIFSSGDHVTADARLLEASALEVDEAALTGESLPVAKAVDGVGDGGARIVLEGTDITTGSGRAVVFAVAEDTRMGATTAALNRADTQQSPLGKRLGALLNQFMPLAGVGGAVVVASGILRGQPVLPQLAVGATIALAAVPEGLPLLAGMGEAAVARRLAGRNALVRRLSAVEALGRVDIACTDKTGTLTEGKLALTLIASADEEATLSPASGADALSDRLKRILIAAALASPHPDAPDARAHPTDMAVVQGAIRAGIEADIRVERDEEAPFDPVRAFHATCALGKLSLKGAPEVVASRCTRMWNSDGTTTELDDTARQNLLDQGRRFAERGLRVLMVAEGGASVSTTDPRELSALGFIGISDPLRAAVPASVRRCREAGVRVIMITGDHPATARAIAMQAGLLQDGEEVFTSAELAEVHNGDLAKTLERAGVIARATPVDKVRIVEALKAHGHTVAMTGDGVNDAPALRLADVGVAMGVGGTDVARQAADVVLADDDFSTLVEALVEGRGFWRNMRRALGLLLGGNLGELGLVVSTAALGLPTPLGTRQILAMNLITDALPALAVALQKPENRNLSELAREGTSALDRPLRNDVLRRGAATSLPSLVAYCIALGSGGGLPLARTVAFSSVIMTQLAQTLDAGRTGDGINRSVVGAVGSSAALLLAALTIPPVRGVLALTLPTPIGWALIGSGALAAVMIGRISTRQPVRGQSPIIIVQPAPPKPQLLAAPRNGSQPLLPPTHLSGLSGHLS